MIGWILLLAGLSFVLSITATAAMKRIAPRIGLVDQPGHRKIHARPKPLGGGVAIYWSIALPVLAAIGLVHLIDAPAWAGAAAVHWDGMRQQSPLALALLAAAGGMHLMGLWDDRRALGPYVKLAVQLGVIVLLVLPFGQLRILTALDDMLGAGGVLSIVLTVLWIATITNAFNFLDNMDGLSAGVAAVASVAFLVTAMTMPDPQWFVAAMLALLLGAAAGFLWHNFAPASIFMGDSGSLVLGLMLGVLTVRTTYLPPADPLAGSWYAVFAPLIVMAVPLYDLIVVSVIRLSRGRSPFVGDTNHLSHRLVRRGMSRRAAVLCIYLMTAATAAAAVVLPHVPGVLAMVIFAQTLLVLCLVAVLEQHPLPPRELEQEMRE